jgi:hypothetical protein
LLQAAKGVERSSASGPSKRLTTKRFGAYTWLLVLWGVDLTTTTGDHVSARKSCNFAFSFALAPRRWGEVAFADRRSMWGPIASANSKVSAIVPGAHPGAPLPRE